MCAERERRGEVSISGIRILSPHSAVLNTLAPVYHHTHNVCKRDAFITIIPGPPTVPCLRCCKCREGPLLSALHRLVPRIHAGMAQIQLHEQLASRASPEPGLDRAATQPHPSPLRPLSAVPATPVPHLAWPAATWSRWRPGPRSAFPGALPPEAQAAAGVPNSDAPHKGGEADQSASTAIQGMIAGVVAELDAVAEELAILVAGDVSGVQVFSLLSHAAMLGSICVMICALANAVSLTRPSPVPSLSVISFLPCLDDRRYQSRHQRSRSTWKRAAHGCMRPPLLRVWWRPWHGWRATWHSSMTTCPWVSDAHHAPLF